MAESVFTKIVRGEIPSFKLYEDDLVYAFLDAGPLSYGHCLIVPKVCYERLEEVPSETSAAMGRVLPALAKAVMAATGAPAYNVLQNNGKLAHQAVDHVHFHIIPKYSPNDQDERGRGLGLQWPAGKLEDDQAAALQRGIVERLAIS